MAFDSLKHALGAENLGTAKAGTNLTAGQYLGVQLVGTGVEYAVTINSGQVCVLYNNPASGEAVTMYGPGHTVKAKSGGTITAGQYITITGSSAFSAVGSAFADVRVGYATTAATSGDIFTLRLT